MGQIGNVPNVSTVFTIITEVQNELGLPAVTSVFNNTDATTVQMLSLLRRVNSELRRIHPTGWANCMQEFNLIVNPPIQTSGTITLNSNTITGISPAVISQLKAGNVQPWWWQVSGASIPQAARLNQILSTSVVMDMEATGSTAGAPIIFSQDTYQYPVDWDWTNNRTHWDRTNRWELLGPDSAQMDQWHRSGIVATGPRRHWRSGLTMNNNGTGTFTSGTSLSQLGRGFRLWPQPVEIVNPLQIAFEYLSSNTVVNTSGSTIAILPDFTADTDFSVLDDQALIMGLKWRFWQIKGFNYVDMKNEWIDYVQTLISRDEGAGTLSLTKRVNPIFLSPSNVQDGFFPGPVGPNSG